VEAGEKGKVELLAGLDVKLGHRLYELLLKEALAGVKENEKVPAGHLMADWDPYTSRPGNFFDELFARLRPECEALIAQYEDSRSALIPMAHLFQDNEGYLSQNAIAAIAYLLGLGAAVVESTVSFYTLFFRKPVGKYMLQVCRNLSCIINGAEEIMAHFKAAGTHENGWMFSTKTGQYGTDYLQRAFITAIGLGANRPKDAVYPTSEEDPDGKPYSGANKYTVHFPKGQTYAHMEGGGFDTPTA